MRRVALALVGAALVAGGALAQVSVYPPPQQDLSGYATTDAVAAMIANAYATQTKLSAPPSGGPGAGLCKFSVVPSNTIQSGGVTGTAGTCSRIVQCGTSATYVVAQFNIGDGC